ncbi:DUF4209 domain-containing protein [Demequina litorisediminis]|uniref:DUF4209 domain-containing protein n=1 Tax=Demequina litorisediminis TaxID=1849022 RepID=A0ABQ6IJG0_9MICO|nr:DUF4209 domain-containing protein [Demequina litorisediminis]GMA36839.1 hypothetical protein GCM10025876_30430 [Demequina litorisediminis]
MQVFTMETSDIGEHVVDLLASIRSDDPVESLRRFAGIQRLASLSEARSEAEQRQRDSPLLASIGRRTLAADGRTIYRSPTSDTAQIYGEPAAAWERMIQHYQIRVSILGGTVLPRAWQQISTEHRFHIGDFQALATGSATVPSTHEGAFARGLHYGYSGDFGTAVHLLVPVSKPSCGCTWRMPANARARWGRMGMKTSLGLSALMENERVVDIFGEDLAFELRALMCGPIGPNLRNEVAHGLVGDSTFSSGVSVYLWWLTLKIVFMPYWNALHNSEAAEAREPDAPHKPSE